MVSVIAEVLAAGAMAAAEGDEERVFGPSLLRMNPAIYATNLEFLRGTISIHHEGHEEKQQKRKTKRMDDHVG